MWALVLSQLLLDQDLVAVRALETVCKDSSRLELAATLLRIFRCERQVVSLLRTIMTQEIEREGIGNKRRCLNVRGGDKTRVLCFRRKGNSLSRQFFGQRAHGSIHENDWRFLSTNDASGRRYGYT